MLAAKPIRLARPVDREFFDRELATFLPDRVFDAHAHVFIEGEVELKLPEIGGSVGYHEYRQLTQDLHPNREVGIMFLSFGSPDRPGSVAAMNDWVAKQVACSPTTVRGAFFVCPEDDPEWVRQEVHRLGLTGLKCYHTYASTRPTFEASIPEFLPEPLVKVADDEGWFITLHMVRHRACADPDNIHWIRHYCQTYPNMKLILAHSARGFQPAHNFEGLSHLKGLDNLYFDTSANCESLAHQTVLREFGPQRLLYGSDLPISHERGRSVAVADMFVFIDERTPIWEIAQLQIEPVLLGLESLRSLKWACWSERLSDSDVEDIFWNNAARLFGIAPALPDRQPQLSTT